jgi:hypothetical protein
MKFSMRDLSIKLKINRQILFIKYMICAVVDDTKHLSLYSFLHR